MSNVSKEGSALTDKERGFEAPKKPESGESEILLASTEQELKDLAENAESDASNSAAAAVERGDHIVESMIAREEGSEQDQREAADEAEALLQPMKAEAALLADETKEEIRAVLESCDSDQKDNPEQPKPETEKNEYSFEAFKEAFEKQSSDYNFQAEADKVVSNYREYSGREEAGFIEAWKTGSINSILRMTKEVPDTQIDALLEYAYSSPEKPPPYESRQQVVNTLVNNLNRLIKNGSGEDVTISEYLTESYKELGVDVTTRFEELDMATKAAAHMSMTEANKDLTDEDFMHILMDEMPIPVLSIRKGDKEVRVPVIGADQNAMTKIGKKTAEGSGPEKSFILTLNIVNNPEDLKSINEAMASMMHEVDHCVRDVLEDQGSFYEDNRFFSEGSATSAAMEFLRTQNEQTPNSGFDASLLVEQAIVGSNEGKSYNLGVGGELISNYGSGADVLNGIRAMYGEKTYQDIAYNLDKSLTKEQVAQLREVSQRKIEANRQAYEDLFPDFVNVDASCGRVE